MICFRSHSDTLIVVLHEIYGINEHITGVCKDFSDKGYDVICPDLLDGKPPYDYNREEEAYRYFMNYEGFDASAKKVAFLLRQEEQAYRHIFLVGYSVGATVAWICCGKSENDRGGFPYGGLIQNLTGVIGFYGSRIRDYTEVNPNCSVLLFFPAEEKSFDPYELEEKLRGKERTEIYILEGKHGFANPFSDNYNDVSAERADRIMKEFFDNRTNGKEKTK